MIHKISRFFYYLFHKPIVLIEFFVDLISPILSDKVYLRLKFRFRMGYWMNFSNPRTFNEKLQWLKLYDRNPEYTMMVDKVKVKDYVSEKIGGKYIIPTISVWDKAEDIDFDTLPNQFVLKCNHNSGGLFICKDKSKVSEEEWRKIKKRLSKSLNTNFYSLFREWPYKNVERKILAEQYMVDESGYELKDYKFFCFNGRVEYCKVDFNRSTDHRANYYDSLWDLQMFGEELCPPKFERNFPCPDNFLEMMELAKQLANGIPFARIDFYSISGRTYFGEITFFPAAGWGKFTPLDTDEKLGNLLKLPLEPGL